MHPTSYEHARKFFKEFSITGKILELGSCNVGNGTLRDHQPPNTEWVGVDLSEGKGVDIVIEDAHSLPFDDNTFDCSISSSVYEHVEFFWETFKEQCRCVKSGGYIYINAPSEGIYHAFPLDCWRFFQDSSIALANWSTKCGYPVEVVKCTVDTDTFWNDCVSVFKKL